MPLQNDSGLPDVSPDQPQEVPAAGGPPGDNPQPAAPPGVICPNCGCRHFLGEDGRPWEVVKTELKFGFIRRRRVCRHCGRVVYTREIPEVRI